MEPRKDMKGAGAGFVGVGVAFLAIGLTGQTAFTGVAMAFVAICVVFLGKARQDR